MKWPMVKLGDVVDIKGGGTPSKETPEYWGGDIPWVSVKDFKSSLIDTASDYITTLGLEKSATNLIPSGTIVVPTRMAVGKVAVLGTDMAINQDLKALIIKNDEELDKRFLLRFLESRADHILKFAKGATVKGITLDVLKDLDVPLPPLEEQKRIAAILDKADAIRRKRQQAIKLADDFLRSVFLDMFGDPVTNPKGWEVVEVETISNVQGGLQVSSKREPNPLTVPYLRVANVLRDRLDLSEIKEINVNDSELNRVRLLTGDILVVEGHGNPDEIGRAAIWDRYVEDIVHQNHLIRIRPDRSKISSIFLNDFINSSGGRTQMANASNTTSGLNTISTGIVKSTKTILPPLEVQAEYEKVVSKVRKFRMDMAQLLANEMEYLFSSLSQKAFSGEL